MKKIQPVKSSAWTRDGYLRSPLKSYFLCGYGCLHVDNCHIPMHIKAVLVGLNGVLIMIKKEDMKLAGVEVGGHRGKWPKIVVL